MGKKKTKIVKVIKVDLDKCNGCRACEVICSAFHSVPKYSSNNPARSRIRVIHEPLRDDKQLESVGNEGLREALARLGGAIRGRSKDRG